MPITLRYRLLDSLPPLPFSAVLKGLRSCKYLTFHKECECPGKKGSVRIWAGLLFHVIFLF